MSEVKRYIIGRNGLPEFHDSGEYVATSDYDALAAKLAMAEDAAEKGDAARQQCGGMEMEIEELRAELAELRARVVVVPERKGGQSTIPGLHRNRGWNACLDELARLNGLTVSEGLLRRLLDIDGIDGIFDAQQNYAAHQELRALLSEQDGGKP
ncbi:hypothetical protein [Pseudomonas aeruginosa]|uniref:hypothetical protein n=1 Tax=Pseudomonas aeruginosa TaxID=287 RepID=UPI0011155F96|nr:hypothetical protein [Pseudomonas aeruginosa]